MNEFLDKSRRATWWLLGSKALSPLLTGAWTLLLVRELSQPDYASFNVFLSLAFYVELLTSSAFALGLRRYLPEAKNRAEADALVGISAGLQITLALLFVGALWGLSGPLSRLLKFDPAYLIPFWAMLFPWLQARLWDVISQANFSHHIMAPSRVLRNGVILGGLWLFSKNGLTVPEALFAFAAAEGLHFLIQLWAYLRVRADLEPGKVEKNLLRRFFKFSLFSYANESAVLFLTVPTDILVLSAMTNPVAVSFYSLAYNLHNAVSKAYPANLLREVISPLLLGIFAQRKNKLELVAGVNLFLKLFLLVEVPVILGFWALGGSFFGWAFGKEYAGAWALVAAFFTYQSLNSLLFLLNTAAVAVEKPQYLLIGRVFSLYNLVADLVLIRLMGAWGAVAATGSSTLGIVLLLWFLLKRDLPLKLHWVGLGALLANGLVVGGLFWALSWLAKGVPGLLGVLLLGAALYYLLLRVINPFTPPERRILHRLLGVRLFG